jgi:hypothetical protein
MSLSPTSEAKDLVIEWTLCLCETLISSRWFLNSAYAEAMATNLEEGLEGFVYLFVTEEHVFVWV